MFKSAAVAFRCTRMSLDLASRVKGPKAPDLAILALLFSCVARLVIHPTALHWTSTFVEFICRINGVKPPSWTMETLFSATETLTSLASPCLEWLTVHSKIAQRSAGRPLDLDIRVLQEEEDRFQGISVHFSDI